MESIANKDLTNVEDSNDSRGFEAINARVAELELCLSATHRRLAEVQRIARIGDWTWDIGRDAFTWSDEVYRIFGMSPSSFTPRRQEILNAVHPDDRPHVEEAVNKSLETGQHWDLKHRILADHCERVIRQRAVVVTDESSQAQRVIGTVQDITEQVRQEDQLRRIQEEQIHLSRLASLGEITSAIAHEVIQPLAAISAYAFTAKLDPGAVQQPAEFGYRELLEKIGRQAQRAGAIVRSILRLSRGNPANRQLVILNELVDEVLHLLAHELRLAGIDVELHLDASLPLVFADSIQIQQVLLNLLRNASDALTSTRSEGRQIVIITQASSKDQAVKVLVRDNGAGVTTAAQDSLFATFRTTKPTGLGIGLAISRRIVEAHHGRIWYESSDGGALFGFAIPQGSNDA
jgi:C4-dicarboxylate-specific signal transduction histidine kinase